jgi:hypothetical protein
MATISMSNVGGGALPHILEINQTKKETVLIGVFNEGIQQGDVIDPYFADFSYSVQKVIESRPPKGDWSGASYKGKKPTYYKLDVVPNKKNKVEGLSNTKA